MAALCRYRPFRAHSLPTGRMAWSPGFMNRNCRSIDRDNSNSGSQTQVIVPKERLGEYGSNPHLRLFRAHMCPIDRTGMAEWD
jgi:hypothetical protein